MFSSRKAKGIEKIPQYLRGRRNGKTAEAIIAAHTKGYTIVTSTRANAENVKKIAKNIGIPVNVVSMEEIKEAE